MTKQQILITAVVIIILGLAAWFFFAPKTQAPTGNVSQTPVENVSKTDTTSDINSDLNAAAVGNVDTGSIDQDLNSL